MTGNLPLNSSNGSALNILEFYKLIKDSKKLIILNIAFFTIASIIYVVSLKPSFETSTILEIGYSIENGKKDLIEKPSELFSDLRILSMKNQNGKLSQGFSMDLYEEKTIILKTTSSSVEKNENLLNEVVNYIFERHSKISLSINDREKILFDNEIKKIEAEIAHYKAKLSDQNQSKYIDIIAKLDKKNQSLQELILLNSISDYNDILFDLNQRLKVIINNLETINSQPVIQSQIIKKLHTKTIDQKSSLIILMGIVFGFVTSVFLVLIISFIKKEEKGQA
jgi:hypothetical protein